MAELESWRREQYKTMEVIATSVAVYKKFGFVAKKNGRIYLTSKEKEEGENPLYPSKDIVLNSLRALWNRNEKPAHLAPVDDNIGVALPTEEDFAYAKKIYDEFLEELTMLKLCNSANDFEKNLLGIIEKEYSDRNVDINTLASIPNSYYIKTKRDTMNDLYEKNREVGSFIVGEIGERVKNIHAKVMDVKWYAKHGVYLFITLTDENQIVKFFMKPPMEAPDTLKRYEGQYITFAGTIKSKKVETKYSNCMETIVHRIHIWDK